MFASSGSSTLDRSACRVLADIKITGRDGSHGELMAQGGDRCELCFFFFLAQGGVYMQVTDYKGFGPCIVAKDRHPGVCVAHYTQGASARGADAPEPTDLFPGPRSVPPTNIYAVRAIYVLGSASQSSCRHTTSGSSAQMMTVTDSSTAGSAAPPQLRLITRD